MTNGMLITFEGVEGCGKTTHVKLLAQYLKTKGYPVVRTLEPGGTKLGEKIRELLLHSKEPLKAYTEVLLFAADRSQHVNEVVLPALKAGQIVICDRFIDSTTAYQIGGRGLPEEKVQQLNALSSEGLVPQLTFLLEIDASEGLGRAVGGGDRFERASLEFHERVRAGYQKLAQQNPDRIKIINSNQEINQVQDEIRRIVEKFLYEKQ